MKKLVLMAFIALVVIGTVSAQGWGWAAPETVSIQGTLQLQNGQFAVNSAGTVYFVPALGRYVGFVDGLREGVQISVEGFASGNYVTPTSFSIGGRTYDLRSNQQAWGNPAPGAPAWCCHYGGGGGPWGYGHHGGRGRRW